MQEMNVDTRSENPLWFKGNIHKQSFSPQSKQNNLWILLKKKKNLDSESLQLSDKYASKKNVDLHALVTKSYVLKTTSCM